MCSVLAAFCCRNIFTSPVYWSNLILEAFDTISEGLNVRIDRYTSSTKSWASFLDRKILISSSLFAFTSWIAIEIVQFFSVSGPVKMKVVDEMNFVEEMNSCDQMHFVKNLFLKVLLFKT